MSRRLSNKHCRIFSTLILLLGALFPGLAQGPERAFLGEVIAKPEFLVDVAAPLWGRIILAEAVFPGARVEKDQELARLILELSAAEKLPLDDRTVQIDSFLQRAQQKLRYALSDYQRAVKIRAQNPDFEDEVARRRSIYENALQEFQQASRQRATQSGVVKSRDPKVQVVTAPRSGYIQDVHFVPGEVNPTDQFRKLVTVVDISRVLVRLELFEKDLAVFRDVRQVEITTPTDPDARLQGRFLYFGDRVDPSTGTIPVFFEVANPVETLRLGLRVQIKPL